MFRSFFKTASDYEPRSPLATVSEEHESVENATDDGYNTERSIYTDAVTSPPSPSLTFTSLLLHSSPAIGAEETLERARGQLRAIEQALPDATQLSTADDAVRRQGQDVLEIRQEFEFHFALQDARIERITTILDHMESESVSSSRYQSSVGSSSSIVSAATSPHELDIAREEIDRLRIDIARLEQEKKRETSMNKTQRVKLRELQYDHDALRATLEKAEAEKQLATVSTKRVTDQLQLELNQLRRTVVCLQQMVETAGQDMDGALKRELRLQQKLDIMTATVIGVKQQLNLFSAPNISAEDSAISPLSATDSLPSVEHIEACQDVATFGSGPIAQAVAYALESGTVTASNSESSSSCYSDEPVANLTTEFLLLATRSPTPTIDVRPPTPPTAITHVRKDSENLFCSSGSASLAANLQNRGDLGSSLYSSSTSTIGDQQPVSRSQHEVLLPSSALRIRKPLRGGGSPRPVTDGTGKGVAHQPARGGVLGDRTNASHGNVARRTRNAATTEVKKPAPAALPSKRRLSSNPSGSSKLKSSERSTERRKPSGTDGRGGIYASLGATSSKRRDENADASNEEVVAIALPDVVASGTGRMNVGRRSFVFHTNPNPVAAKSLRKWL